MREMGGGMHIRRGGGFIFGMLIGLQGVGGLGVLMGFYGNKCD